MKITSLSHLHAEFIRLHMQKEPLKTYPVLVMSKRTMRMLVHSRQPFLIKPVVGSTLRDELMGCQIIYDKHTPSGEVEFYMKLK